MFVADPFGQVSAGVRCVHADVCVAYGRHFSFEAADDGEVEFWYVVCEEADVWSRLAVSHGVSVEDDVELVGREYVVEEYVEGVVELHDFLSLCFTEFFRVEFFYLVSF